MNTEKASTLRLLRQGIGNTVNVLEHRSEDALHEVRALLPDHAESSVIPVLFLLTSLAFLEAPPVLPEVDENSDFNEVDGWLPADLLSHLRFEEKQLRVSLSVVRGRAIFTDIAITANGELTIRTQARGQSASRWLTYVQGRSHLQPT